MKDDERRKKHVPDTTLRLVINNPSLTRNLDLVFFRPNKDGGSGISKMAGLPLSIAKFRDFEEDDENSMQCNEIIFEFSSLLGELRQREHQFLVKPRHC